MLNIKKFVCNMFQENCYIVNDETKECVIIDCGALYEEEKSAIKNYIKTNELVPKHLLCTHGHIDHNLGNKMIYDEFGLKAEVFIADEPLMDKLEEQAAALMGLNIEDVMPPVDCFTEDKKNIEFGTHEFEVLNTPGHTPGSVFFYCKAENIAFSGDTLFKCSIGRTDFEFGDYDAIIKSLEMVSRVLPHNTEIYSGHGPSTNIKDEIMYNPFLR